jgi:hypothetical protein
VVLVFGWGWGKTILNAVRPGSLSTDMLPP